MLSHGLGALARRSSLGKSWHRFCRGQGHYCRLVGQAFGALKLVWRVAELFGRCKNN